MSPGRRMAVLEREAGRLLHKRGYDSISVSDAFQDRHYIPYNLIAHRLRDDGSDDTLIVKIKVALRRFDAKDADVFCRAEIMQVKNVWAGLPAELEGARYECWVSIPPDMFQQFEITARGLREIAPDQKQDAPAGGAG
jgi:hypothetical protein